MPVQTDVVELFHWFGSDLVVDNTGDLLVVGNGINGSAGQITRSNQRVLRRVMTVPGQYIFARSYGGGVPVYVGKNLDVAKVTSAITGQMQIEDSVAQSPPPTAVVTPFLNGVDVTATYTVSPLGLPAVLSFTSEP